MSSQRRSASHVLSSPLDSVMVNLHFHYETRMNGPGMQISVWFVQKSESGLPPSCRWANACIRWARSRYTLLNTWLKYCGLSPNPIRSASSYTLTSAASLISLDRLLDAEPGDIMGEFLAGLLLEQFPEIVGIHVQQFAGRPVRGTIRRLAKMFALAWRPARVERSRCAGCGALLEVIAGDFAHLRSETSACACSDHAAMRRSSRSIASYRFHAAASRSRDRLAACSRCRSGMRSDFAIAAAAASSSARRRNRATLRSRFSPHGRTSPAAAAPRRIRAVRSRPGRAASVSLR